jgi:hypothetical protein
VLTEDEAHEWLIVFTRSYPDFAKWRYTHSEQCKAQGCIIIGRGAASGFGRIYALSQLPAGMSPYTRSCNFPIQGACADASMLALTAIDQMLFDAGIDGGPIAWVHDEILLEVPAGDAERAAKLLERAMVHAFEETFPGSREMGLLNGLVDIHIGSNWAEAKSPPPQPAPPPPRAGEALDLYCGAGGASRGLQQAGFKVTGVDITPQPNYCGDAFIQSDVFEYLATAGLSRFDLIWASPRARRIPRCATRPATIATQTWSPRPARRSSATGCPT